MFSPVSVKLSKNGHVFEECIVNSADDLRFPVEMLTGTGWIEADGLYQLLLDKGCDEISDTFRVCHSYEKWGDLQQEVVKITVRMQRLKSQTYSSC